MAVLEIVQHGLGQAELRDAVAQHAADLIVALKDRDVVAVTCQNDRNGQARRAGADDGGLFAVGRRGTLGHLAGVGGRDVVLDDREVHRRTFDAAHAMALALVFVVADQRADRRQGVVLKQHTARFVELVGLQKADDLGNIGVDRAALLAAGHLAAKAVVCFVHYVQRHVLLLHFAPILRVKNATMLYHTHFLSI